MDRELHAVVKSIFPAAVQLRRQIHANPELSGSEYATTRRIAGYLRTVGLTPRYHMAKTGLSARQENGSGPVVVLRADTDALPIQEENRVSYASRISGIMHACGHDMHIACLAGAAAALTALRERWRGSVVVLFQPAEEIEPGGALQMIQEGAFPADAAMVAGLHVSVDHAAGQIGIKSGAECAAITVFQVLVTGRGGHGAMPERAINPLGCAAAMVTGLPALVQKSSSRTDPAVLSIGSLHGGTKYNVIPDEAVFSGSLRTFSARHQDKLIRSIASMLKHHALAHRCEVRFTHQKSYPAGYNDPHLARRAKRIFSELLGTHNLIARRQPVRFSDDFVYYQQRCPGLYMHLGVRPKGVRTAPGIHSAHFLPDESAITTGIMALTGLALDTLGR
jgi:amidohydrolase